MILIVEGANRTGKSTLIASLEKLDEKKNIIGDLLKQDTNEKLIVFDRFHISEFVYGEAFRGYTNDLMFKVGDFLQLMDAKILYMKSDFKHVTDRHKALEYEALQSRFNEAFAKHFMCENVKIVSLDGKDEHGRAYVAKEVLEWALS